MAVKMRLTRMGRKKRPFYRIVVADERSPRDGRNIESIGTYNPIVEPPEIRVAEDRVFYWLDNGVQPTDTVRSILKSEGLLHKRFLQKRGFDEKRLDEEMKKWEVLQIEKNKKAEAAAEKALKEKQKAKEKEEKAKAEEEAKAAAEAETETAETMEESAAESEAVQVEAVEEAASAEEAKEEVKEEAEAVPVEEPKAEVTIEATAEENKETEDAPAEEPKE